MKFRKFTKRYIPNDGKRTLFQSVASDLVYDSLRRLMPIANSVLIGDIAVSYFAKPYYSTDIDLLYLDEKDIPNNIRGFKKEGGNFVDSKNGVVLHTHTTASMDLRSDVVDRIFKTSVVSSGFRIASANGLVVLKLTRFSSDDRLCICKLMKCSRISLVKFNLTEGELESYAEVTEYYKVTRIKYQLQLRQIEKLNLILKEVKVNSTKSIRLIQKCKVIDIGNQYVNKDVNGILILESGVVSKIESVEQTLDGILHFLNKAYLE